MEEWISIEYKKAGITQNTNFEIDFYEETKFDLIVDGVMESLGITSVKMSKNFNLDKLKEEKVGVKLIERGVIARINGIEIELGKVIKASSRGILLQTNIEHGDFESVIIEVEGL